MPVTAPIAPDLPSAGIDPGLLERGAGLEDDRRRPRPRLAAIVPAFNEEETLAAVLAALDATPGIDEVIVVSDGSTDGTVEIARRLGVKAIHLRENQGKGTAMAVGVAHTDAPVLLFVDGDILHLTSRPLVELVAPVLDGRSGMNIGLRHRGRLPDAVHQRWGPHLSGIRCLLREVFEAVPERNLRGFAIETGLNWACRQLGLRLTTTLLYDLKHLVKEKKRGLVAGSIARLHMFAAVFLAWGSLRLDPPPLNTRQTRSETFPWPGPFLLDQTALELEYINFQPLR